ncbi:hypothetical protein JCM10450v2_004240 [Rhodotorula kratochvilovae]
MQPNGHHPTGYPTHPAHEHPLPAAPAPPGSASFGAPSQSQVSSPQSSTAHSCAGGAESKPRTGSYVPTRTGEPASTVRRSAKACLYCRKGKARCDGLDNWPCRRCRESGVECVFEGISGDELRKRMQVKGGSGSSTPAPSASASPLEARLARIESELALLRSTAGSHTSRLDRLERFEESDQRRESPPSENGEVEAEAPVETGKKRLRRESDDFQAFARKAFDLFWEMYAPLAPYIVPNTDRFEEVKERSPLLMHCIVAVAARHSSEKTLVDFNRNEALRLMRETLYAERPVTLDDLKGSLVWNAWLGKGAPPGHTVTLALQLDLPRSLERLVASASQPAAAAEIFEQLMPAARIWLTLYAQDIWLSFSLNRRPLVTIDLSVTSSRLLLAFRALRPVDARLIAQSELVTVLGVVQESFLKLQRQSVEQTVQVIQQANAHLEQWITTWSAWASTQEEEAGRYILASFSVMLQSARFFANTLGLRDITSAEEFLPIHLPFLRTALDAAVRIQGIHRAQKVAHSAEMTMISLSSGALFLLKMIKLVPTAFSPTDCPAYPSSAFPTSFNAAITDQLTSASSPDTSASSLQHSFPSIKQAFAAARHSAALLASAPPSQQKHAQAVKAAVEKLEAEMAALHPALLPSKRARDEDASSPAAPAAARPPLAPASAALAAASPYWSLGMGFSPGGTLGAETITPPAGFWATDSADVLAAARGGASGAGADGAGELDELTIESLIGTDSFWNWTSTLPGQDMQAIIS